MCSRIHDVDSGRRELDADRRQSVQDQSIHFLLG